MNQTEIMDRIPHSTTSRMVATIGQVHPKQWCYLDACP